MLLFAGTFLRMCYNYRIIWIGGRYGGGKTLLAFLLAYELLNRFGLRYLFSNCLSVWNDDPNWMQQREGQWCDAALVLDEAGEFMETPSDVKSWVSFFRKVNIVTILPSVRPPHHSVRFLTVQRILNLNVIGLPVWVYRWDLDNGANTEFGYFTLLFPGRMFGIYDTQGFPEDADVLLSKVKLWKTKAAIATGYKTPSFAPEIVANLPDKYGHQARTTAASGVQAGYPGDQAMDNVRGDIDALIQATKKAEKVVSLSRRKSHRR